MSACAVPSGAGAGHSASGAVHHALHAFFWHCLTADCLCRTFLIRDVMDEMMLNGLVQDTVLLELSIMHCMPFSGTA